MRSVLYKLLVTALCASALVFLPSCAVMNWFMGKTSDEEVAEMDKDISGLGKRTTRYDSALGQFGVMLEAYNLSGVKIQSKPIRNQTAEKGLPDDIRGMAETSLNKMTKQITLIPYDPAYYTAEVTTGGKIERTLPDIVIDGGLAEFDKDMIEKERKLEAEAEIKEGDFGSNADQDAGAGYKAKSGVSRLGLDLHLLNYATQAAISGKQSSNTVNIRKTQFGWSIGYYLKGCGLSFESQLKKQQGLHSAIRLLVEMSIIELIGKYYDVPYWRCIEGAQPDEAMCTRLTEEFNDAPDNTQNAYIKEYLFLHGCEGFDRKTVTFDQNEKKSLDEIMAKRGATNKTDLFIKLWLTIPIEDARKRVKEYRKLVEQQRQVQLEAQRKARLEQLRQAQLQAEEARKATATQPQPAAQPAVQPQPAPQPVQPAPQPKPKPAETPSSKEKPVGIGRVDEF